MMENKSLWACFFRERLGSALGCPPGKKSVTIAIGGHGADAVGIEQV